jgi:hypothetical protein
VVRAALEKDRASIIGSKTPGPASGYEMRILRQLFSRIQFVYVVRNPLDTINSTLNRRNLARGGFDQWHIADVRAAIDEYRENMNLLRSQVAADPENCFVLGYEDLMRAPSETIEKLGEFLGCKLRCSPAIAQRDRGRKTVMTPEEVAILRNELGSVIDSWDQRKITGGGPEMRAAFDDCIRTIVPKVSYRFGIESRERSLLGSGWSTSEAGGVWSDDYTSDLHFAVEQSGSYAIGVETGAFVPRGQPQLRIAWSLDNVPLGELGVEDDRPRKVESQPVRITSGAHRLTLGFNVPRSPQQLGISNDYRLLGIFLRSLQLEERL